MSCKYRHSARLMAILSGVNEDFFAFSIDARLRAIKLNRRLDDSSFQALLDKVQAPSNEVLDALAQYIPNHGDSRNSAAALCLAAAGLRDLIVAHPSHPWVPRWEAFYCALTNCRPDSQIPSVSEDLVQRVRQALCTVAQRNALHSQLDVLIQLAQEDPDFAAQLLMVRADLPLPPFIEAARRSPTWAEWKWDLLLLRSRQFSG